MSLQQKSDLEEKTSKLEALLDRLTSGSLFQTITAFILNFKQIKTLVKEILAILKAL